jgi:hypothetical protein
MHLDSKVLLSCHPQERPPASLEDDNLVVLYYLISVHLKSGLIRGVVSLEDDNLVVLYYLSASEIWPKVLLSCHPQERPPLLSGQISDVLR